uniref:Uncharacterized protein n=1 Tax=Hemiselmis andersenii TaxID=464988 RepID=A0A6U4WYU0_HEMAN|mmetsp:Transcript_33701/g.82192  ORF Transcript_33701/g.82192 Transcript_33701/m.82192 type:complete len:226 (+) Transcript_33701:2-679(+)
MAMREKALGAQRRIAGSHSDKAAFSLYSLGHSYREQGMLEEARAKYEEGLGIVRQNHPERNALEGRILCGLGLVYTAQGKLEDALAMFKKTHRIFRKTLGSETVEMGTLLGDIGDVLDQQDKHDEAMEKYVEGLAILRRVVGNDSPRVAVHLYNMAVCKVHTQDVFEAVDYLKEAQRIYRTRGISSGSAVSVASMLEKLERVIQQTLQRMSASMSAEGASAAGDP